MSAATFRRACRLAFFACALGVLVLSLMSPATSDVVSFGWDMANHALAFFALGVLALLGFRAPAGWILAALIGYGVAIEGLQSLTADRSAEWADLLADAIGLAAAWAAVGAGRFAARGSGAR